MENSEKKIRVLHVLGSMNMGGIQMFLMNVFRKIDRDQYMFDFACMNPVNIFQEEIEHLGGHLYWIDSYRNFLNHKKRFYQILEENEYDYIHIHSGNAICVLDAVLAKSFCRKQKVVYHSHNASGRMKYLHGICKALIPRFTDWRFACSYEAARWMYPKSVVGAKQYTVISNGIDVEKFKYSSETREQARIELKLGEELAVGHVGRIDVQKNHRFLLEIFACILKKAPQAKLLLVGTGPLENEIKAKAEQLGIAENVLFLGIRNDVERILCACDVFCLPSLFEGFGIVNIEAQACGLPCYISDVITSEVAVTPLLKKESLEASPEIWAERIRREQVEDRAAYNELVARSRYALSYTVDQLCTFYRGVL